MKPTRIVTNLVEIRRICENQSPATREQKLRSILAQNGKISASYVHAVGSSDWFKRAHDGRSIGLEIPIE